MKKAEVDWVFLGPEPYFAHCERCGGTVAMPILPTPVDALIAYTDYAMALHKDCQPSREAAA